jgi:hypothetical protein
VITSVSISLRVNLMVQVIRSLCNQPDVETIQLSDMNTIQLPDVNTILLPDVETTLLIDVETL